MLYYHKFILIRGLLKFFQQSFTPGSQVSCKYFNLISDLYELSITVWTMECSVCRLCVVFQLETDQKRHLFLFWVPVATFATPAQKCG